MGSAALKQVGRESEVPGGRRGDPIPVRWARREISALRRRTESGVGSAALRRQTSMFCADRRAAGRREVSTATVFFLVAIGLWLLALVFGLGLCTAAADADGQQ